MMNNLCDKKDLFRQKKIISFDNVEKMANTSLDDNLTSQTNVCLKQIKIESDICSMIKYFGRIEDYVRTEADFDIKMCNFFGQDLLVQQVSQQSFPFSGIEASNSHYDSDIFTRQCPALLTSGKKLKSSVLSCMLAISECFESRRTVYLTQIRKIRDLSNMATRNAIQNERSEANIASARLKHSFELDINSALKAAHDKVLLLERENIKFKDRVETLNTIVSELREKDHDRVAIQNRAVVSALTLRDEEQRLERNKHFQLQHAESARVVAETNLQIQAIIQQSKCDQDTHRRYNDELCELLVVERSRLERECENLREQITGLQTEIAEEKKIWVARSADERTRFEHHLQDVLSDNLRVQTQMKTDLSHVALCLKSENSRRSTDLDTKMARFRDVLLTSHAVEVETLGDRHRAEIKRVQVDLQVRAQEVAFKRKHVFEQELSRLLRANNRLQKIVVRNGGLDLLSESTEIYEVPVSAQNNSLTSFTPGGTNAHDREQSLRKSFSHFDESLRMQDKRDREAPVARPPPPVPFGVEEAYQSSMDGRSSGGGGEEGVGANAKRLSGYLGRLEQYLSQHQNNHEQNSSDNQHFFCGVSSSNSDTDSRDDSLEIYSLGSAANLVLDLSGRTSSIVSSSLN